MISGICRFPWKSHTSLTWYRSIQFEQMREQILVLILLLNFPVIGLCQSRFSFGGSFNYGNNHIVVNESQLPFGVKNKSEFGPSYSIGFDTRVSLSKTWFTRTGLHYINRNYQPILEGIDFALVGPFSMESSIKDEIIISSIGIPIDLGFILKEGKKGEEFHTIPFPTN